MGGGAEVWGQRFDCVKLWMDSSRAVALQAGPQMQLSASLPPTHLCPPPCRRSSSLPLPPPLPQVFVPEFAHICEVLSHNPTGLFWTTNSVIKKLHLEDR